MNVQAERDIGLLAATLHEARHLMAQMRHAAPLEHTRLVACGMDQGWPDRRFDELHWLGEMACQLLSELADILHVHHLPGQRQTRHAGARHYGWGGTGELTTFWASLYRAREQSGGLGLDWRTFADWRPGECVGRTFSGHGASIAAASDALSGVLRQCTGVASGQGLLIIEAAGAMTLGEQMTLVERFTHETGVEVIPTGGWSGAGGRYQLRLLLFIPALDGC